MDFFTKLFDTSDFSPRWSCGLWTPAHGWLHILSDLGVWSAYLAIPCVLGFFVLRKKDVPLRTLFWLFGAFILACGTTHLMEAIIFWWPAYRLAGVIKLLTAIVSWATVIALVPIVPRALAMRSPEELEREIAERQKAEEALRRAKEAAEAANRAKDDFLANVSHEIRTPMNAILGMTELTLATVLTEDQRQCLQTSQSAANNLLAMINDLLDFSKIEAGKIELDPAPFSVRTSLGDTLRALAMRAHQKGLELACHVQPDVPDALVGDASRLRQVLLNLVGNAIKFTDQGEVVVRVSRIEDRGSRIEEDNNTPLDPRSSVVLHFAVSDTGIGIPRDKQETIFRAFEQEDTSTTRKYGGTGLGLTIAARLVALMGGKITVDSEPGRGSTFAFTAQLGPQHPSLVVAGSGDHATTGPQVLLRNLPVLIVDDNATNRYILKEWLRGWQMEPVAVGDAGAAMDVLGREAARGRAYALVLLDVCMPGTDGLTLAAMIRKKPELSATRIILLTSGKRLGDRDRSRELNVGAHLLKPVPQDELLGAICRVMGQTDGRAPLAREPAPVLAKAAPLRILVAEDNEFNVRHLQRLLARRGHSVRLAGNGREALNLAVDTPFDVLLLDLHMPELDGFQVIRAIRERESAAGGHLPVIALTARSRKEDRERCLAAGMDLYLSKPVQAAELFAAIDQMVAAHGASRLGQQQAGESPSLLDPDVLLAACGGDAEGLREVCLDFQAFTPGRLAEVGDALRDRDAARLREAAHKLCGLLSAFSPAAGNLASGVEDHAAAGQLDEVRPLVSRLETMVQKLMQQVNGLSPESLRRQVGTASDPNQAAGPENAHGALPEAPAE